MSYPRVIQTLVVEDEQEAKENYEAAFASLVASGIAAPPRYAFCYQDAIAQLRSDVMFHLVILDLRLPEYPETPAWQTVDLGLNVMAACATRDRYPIPAVIVRSAYLGETNQVELTARVAREFAYGAVLVKGGRLDNALETAIRAVHAYSDVGIHFQDTVESHPPLSPRDEDLLRRCMIEHGHLGVDLRWWSGDYAKLRSGFESCSGWTKVLIGRFILKEGMGLSRPTFFKFAPAGDTDVLRRGAKILSHKLAHVKEVGFVAGGNRCLLATQKVGDGEDRSVTLESFLAESRASVTGHLKSVAVSLASQVRQLGERSPDTTTLRKLLWADLDRVIVQWERWRSQEADTVIGDCKSPPVVLEALLQSERPVRYCRQSCTHGDLNATNIALDVFQNYVRPYIFDAGWCCAAPDIRDLAMLEATILLHQKPIVGNLVAFCAQLFEDRICPPDDLVISDASAQAANTLQFLAELRIATLSELEDERLYPLLLFDNVLMQLAGLSEQVTSNKIRRPEDAALLAAHVTRWFCETCGDHFGVG